MKASKLLFGLVALCAAVTGTQAATIILDGAQLLQETAAGAYAGTTDWNTAVSPSDLAKLGIGTTPGSATYINTGAGDLAYALSTGTTHFVLVSTTEAGLAVPYLGTNLFFNETAGTSAPQISAYDLGDATGNQPDYAYNAGPEVPGGLLAVTFGTSLVTLTNYVEHNGVSGQQDYATFDLTVTPVVVGSAPEPMSLFLIAPFLLGGTLLRGPLAARGRGNS